jgi:hypothetical protein
MMRRLTGTFAAMMAFILLTAARPARVITGTAEILAEPRSDAQVLESLSNDAPVAISNQPTEGYFKVRTSAGKVGWISASVVQAEGEVPDAGQVEDLAQRSTGGPRIDRGTGVAISLLGGAAFGVPPDINVLFGLEGARTYFGAGAEVEWRFTRRFGFLLRGEWQGENAVIVNTDGTATFTYVSFASPLQIGLNWAMIAGRSFELGLGAMGGISPVTWVSTEELPNTSGDAATFASTVGFTAAARLNAIFAVTSRFSLFLEGGWRMLLTAPVIPLEDASGSALWKNNDTQEFIPLTLSNSGPFIGGGLRIHF